MKWKLLVALLIFTSSAISFADSPRASMKSPPISQSPEYQAALADIKTTLGSVPSFFKNYPESALPGAWQVFKNVQMSSNSSIPPKYKELLGLAVASQIPCKYCTFFHTEAGKLSGTTENEQREAVALAALGRQWAAIIDGGMQDESSFRAETDRIMQNLKAKRLPDGSPMPVSATTFSTAEETYRDMETTIGVVPAFVKQFPREGVTGIWKQTKALLFSSNTAIPGKYKNLISLGVSSQLPCQKCVYWDTEAARLNGASEAEIHEAVAMASIATHWSTVLNGSQLNEAVFRKEILQTFAHLKDVNTRETRASNMSMR